MKSASPSPPSLRAMRALSGSTSCTWTLWKDTKASRGVDATAQLGRSAQSMHRGSVASYSRPKHANRGGGCGWRNSVSGPMPRQNKDASAKVKVPKMWRDVDAARQAAGGQLVPGPSNPFCVKCGMMERGCRAPVGPWGADRPRLSVFFESISPKEDDCGKLGVADTRNGFIRSIILRAAKQCGLNEDDIRWVPLSRCANREKGKVEWAGKIAWCRAFALEDMAAHPPDALLAIGTAALGALCHKSSAQSWSGKPLNWRGWPDDWLTDRRYLVSHPAFGRPTGAPRAALWAVQAPVLVYATQNRRVIKAWEEMVRRTVEDAFRGVRAPPSGRPYYRMITDPGEAATLLDAVPEETVLSHDTETTGLLPFGTGARVVTHMIRYDAPDGTPVSLAFPWDYEGSPLRDHLPILRPKLKAALCRSRLYGHYYNFDALFTIANDGADIWDLTSAIHGDTRHMAYSIHQGNEAFGLDLLAYDWVSELAGYEEEFVLLKDRADLSEKLDPAAEKGGHYANALLMPEVPRAAEAYRDYCLGDVEVVHLARPRMRERIDQSRPAKIPIADPERPGEFIPYQPPSTAIVYDRILLRSQRVFARMMARGMHVDVEECARQELLFPKMIREARGALRKVDPRIVEWCAQQEATVPEWKLDLEKKDQLSTLLFDILGLQPKRLTKSGEKLFGDLEKLPPDQVKKYAAIDKYTINSFLGDHPELAPLKEYRRHYKAYTSFVRPMRNSMAEGIDRKAIDRHPHLMPDGCVHATLDNIGTRSGRPSCVAGFTVLETDGGPIEIRDLDMNSGALKIKTHENRWRRITGKFYQGVQGTWRVKTASGRELVCTGTHRLYTSSGWRQTCQVKVGEDLIVDNGSGLSPIQAEGLPLRFRRCGGRLREDFPGGGVIVRATGGHGLGAEEGVPDKLLLDTEKPGVCFEVGGTQVQAAFGGRHGESARGPAAVSDTAKGGAVRVAVSRVRELAHCERIEDNCLFGRSEHPVSCAEAGNRPAAACRVRIHGESDRRDRESGPRIASRAGFRGQKSVCATSLQVIPTAAQHGLLHEADLQDHCAVPQGIPVRTSEPELVHKLQGNFPSPSIDGRGNSAHPGVCLFWDEAGRLRHHWHESVGGGGRERPYRRTGRLPESGNGIPGVQAGSIQGGAGGQGSAVRCCGDQVRDRIVSIEFEDHMDVWDIEVEEDHSYTTLGGVISHNCKRPNLLNLDKKSIIKRMYDSRWGKEGAIYQPDLSQIELRVQAAACGDPLMIKAFNEDIDLHSLTASRIFNLPYEHLVKAYWKTIREAEAKELELKRSIAKCVDPSTWVTIGGRLTRIGSVHAGRDTDVFYDVTPGTSVQSPAGSVPVRQFYSNGPADRLLVCTRRGLVACSASHRFLSADGRWIAAQDLIPGVVLANPEVPLAAGDRLGQFQVSVDEKLAYFLGLFYGDGGVSRNSIMINTGGKPEHFVWQDQVAKISGEVGLPARVVRTIKNRKTGYVHGRVIFGSCRAIGIFRDLGAVRVEPDGRPVRTLEVPEWMMNASNEIRLSFLAGLMDTDGTGMRQGCFSVTMESWKFAQDIMTMMCSVGMATTLEPAFNRTYNRYYFRINITLRSSWDFLRGRRLLPSKVARLRAPTFRHKEEKPNTVQLILPIGPGELVDLSVDHPDHFYVANGLVTHNTVNFLVSYGGGGFGLQTTLAEEGVYRTLEECEGWVEAMFDTYPSLRRYVSMYKRFVLRHGCAVSLLGRVRPLEDAYSDDYGRHNKALRAGFNHLIQATASDMMMICMSLIDQMSKDRCLESMLVSTVYDSLVFDVRRQELPALHDIVALVLDNIPEVVPLVLGEDACDFRWLHTVPFEWDAEVGPNYGSLAKVGAGTGAEIDWMKLLGKRVA